MIYLIHGKNLCKCHNVPPPSTTIKEKKKKTHKCVLYIISMHNYIRVYSTFESTFISVLFIHKYIFLDAY
jgi:hypothetical protein